MEHVKVADGYVEAWERGAGEPLLLIHGALISDEWGCIVDHPALSGFRIMYYRRRGYGGSVSPQGPFSVAQQAGDAAAVLRHFGVDRAHIVGHSYGGATALQLAVDRPDCIHTLALLEPALAWLPSAEVLGSLMPEVFELYAGGHRARSVEFMIEQIGGEGATALISKNLPADWSIRAQHDLDATMQVELPALEGWVIPPERAAQITMPTLAVVGGQAVEWFRDSVDWVLKNLPNAERFTMVGAGHMLHMIDPDQLAGRLGDFLAGHPISAPSG